ncbi:DUF6207 family protein [Streptomyces sp. NPDC056178]|uniref:DUF6207 family protein n=2 Tax=unclassified Streptomyces TaxID=2593676 RepID=UPI0035D7A6D9
MEHDSSRSVHRFGGKTDALGRFRSHLPLECSYGWNCNQQRTVCHRRSVSPVMEQIALLHVSEPGLPVVDLTAADEETVQAVAANSWTGSATTPNWMTPYHVALMLPASTDDGRNASLNRAPGSAESGASRPAPDRRGHVADVSHHEECPALRDAVPGLTGSLAHSQAAGKLFTRDNRFPAHRPTGHTGAFFRLTAPSPRLRVL